MISETREQARDKILQLLDSRNLAELPLLNAVMDAVDAYAQALRERPQPCTWTQDEIDGGWDTACGQSWVFENDGPDENHVTFCHGCGGRRVNAPPAPSQET